jgi:hypothetical protein
MLTTENLYEEENGYLNGEYGSLIRRLMSRTSQEIKELIDS